MKYTAPNQLTYRTTAAVFVYPQMKMKGPSHMAFVGSMQQATNLDSWSESEEQVKRSLFNINKAQKFFDYL